MNPHLPGLIHTVSDWETALLIAGTLGGSMGALWILKQYQKIKHRKARPKRTNIFTGRMALGLGITLLALGGMFVASMLFLGLGWASFGLVTLAVLCTVASVAALILGAIGIFKLINPETSGRQGFANGCGLVIMTLFIFIPAGLAVGGFLNILFLSLFLGLTVFFGTALLLWLINVGFLLICALALVFLVYAEID